MRKATCFPLSCHRQRPGHVSPMAGGRVLTPSLGAVARSAALSIPGRSGCSRAVLGPALGCGSHWVALPASTPFCPCTLGILCDGARFCRGHRSAHLRVVFKDHSFEVSDALTGAMNEKRRLRPSALWPRARLLGAELALLSPDCRHLRASASQASRGARCLPIIRPSRLGPRAPTQPPAPGWPLGRVFGGKRNSQPLENN